MTDPIKDLIDETLSNAGLDFAFGAPKPKKTQQPEEQKPRKSSVSLPNMIARRATQGAVGGGLGGLGLWGLGQFIPALASVTPHTALGSLALGSLLGLGGGLVGAAVESVTDNPTLGDLAEITAGFISPQAVKAGVKKFIPITGANIPMLADDVTEELVKRGAKNFDEISDTLRALRDITNQGGVDIVADVLRGAKEPTAGLKILLEPIPAEEKLFKLATQDPATLREVAKIAAAAREKKLADFLTETSNRAITKQLDDVLQRLALKADETPVVVSERIKPQLETMKRDFYDKIANTIKQFAENDKFKEKYANSFKELKKFKFFGKKRAIPFDEALFYELNRFRRELLEANDLVMVDRAIKTFESRMNKVVDRLGKMELPEELKNELIDKTLLLKKRGLEWKGLSLLARYLGLREPQQLMEALENPSSIASGVGTLARRLVDIRSIPYREGALEAALREFANTNEAKEVLALADLLGEDFGRVMLSSLAEATKDLVERGQGTTYSRTLGTPLITVANFLKEKGLLGKISPEDLENIISTGRGLDVLGLNFANVLKEAGLPAERQVSQTAAFLSNLNPLDRTKVGGLANLFLRAQDEVSDELKKEALAKALTTYRLLTDPSFSENLTSGAVKQALNFLPEGYLSKGAAKQLLPSLGQAATALGTDVGRFLIEEEMKQRGFSIPKKEYKQGNFSIPQSQTPTLEPNTTSTGALEEFRALLQSEQDPFKAIEKYGKLNTSAITEELLDTLEQVESGGNPRAISRKGALGAYQFMPATAQWLGIDPFDPKQAREGAKKYLEIQLNNFGNLPLALAAYNWGEGNLRKLIEKQKTNDWKTLYRFLPKETRTFLASFGYKPEA